MTPKGMALPDVLGLVILKEQFRLSDLLVKNNEGEVLDKDLYEVDCFSPVFKWLTKPSDDDLEDYIEESAVPLRYRLPYAQLQFEEDFSTEEYMFDLDYYTHRYPLYRTFFDFTAGSIRQFANDERLVNDTLVARRIHEFPLDVQIRFQFLEPRADTIQPKGARRFLRAGNIQFIIVAGQGILDGPAEDTGGVDFGFGRPIGELFRLAQHFITTYGSTTARNILASLDKINYGNDIMNNATEKVRILEKLFPDYSIHEAHVINIDMVRNVLVSGPRTLASFNTLTPVTTNIRFAPPDRPTHREFEPSYGLAVTVPFNYEQEV